MTQLKSREELPALGIMHPAMADRWRILIADKKLLTLQATKVQIDMLASTVTAFIEQPAAFAQDMLEDIRSLGRRRQFNLCIDLLDSSENTLGKIAGWAEMKEHQLILDYADGTVATHRIVFSYTPPAPTA